MFFFFFIPRFSFLFSISFHLLARTQLRRRLSAAPHPLRLTRQRARSAAGVLRPRHCRAVGAPGDRRAVRKWYAVSTVCAVSAVERLPSLDFF